MRRSEYIIGMLALAVLLTGCGLSQPVRVLPNGATALTASIGGPIVPTSSPTGFVPYFTAGAMHGINEHVTLHGNLHLLAAAFVVVGIDVGASARAVRQDGIIPEMTFAARLLTYVEPQHLDATRVFPTLSFNGSWQLSSSLLYYVGAHNTFQQADPQYLFSPFTGVQFDLDPTWSLQAEFNWQAANVNTEAGIFEGESTIGSTGSAGMFIGMVYHL
jgi:hypothetical protein